MSPGLPARDRAPQWLFLRALGLIFATAFTSLWTQIHGLIGPRGILPAKDFLESLAADRPGLSRLWEAPGLLWLSSGDLALDILCGAGLLAGLALTFDLWPRISTAVATLAYLSFISVAQVFAQYQSDGMLLEAGVLSIFLAAPHARDSTQRFPLSRIALWLLRWEWFRLYFESGFVKWFGGDPQWHALTALDRYYENGPLPTWLAWVAQQRLPHAFHAASAALTLILELFAPLVLFLPWRRKWPRRVRLAALALCTALQLGILATANYAFINHLALALGLLLLDDEAVVWISRLVPARVRNALSAHLGRKNPSAPDHARPLQALRIAGRGLALVLFAAMLWTTLLLFPGAPLRSLPEVFLMPAQALSPFRIANRFGLFGRMTDARYELEFQGSNDGVHWTAYPFRRKPQDVMAAPGFYAPHQPRFDWNLWFASLGQWREDSWTLAVCEGILQGNQAILHLFAGDPFEGKPPARCRIERWQYWFTTPDEKAATGAWWRREDKGVWAPVLIKQGNQIVAEPDSSR